MATKKSFKRFEVRRLNNNELGQIIHIQKEAKDLLSFYNEEDHERWLYKAIEEIKAGKRIAFGVFGFLDNDETSFVGSSIIKRGTRSSYVQIKNFIILKSISEKRKYNIKKALLNNLESFCSIRGFKALEIEFPADLSSEISTFLSHDFKISTIRKSRYREGDYHYVLEKKLNRIYMSDPFNESLKARWIIHEVFNFPSSSTFNNKHINYRNKKSINNSFVFPLTNNSKLKNEILGGCIFSDKDNSRIDLPNIDLANIDICYYFSNFEYGRANENGVIVYGKNITCNFFNEKSTVHSVTIEKKEVQGILTIVDSNFNIRIRNQSEGFTYYIPSGLGDVLNTSIEVEQERTYLLFANEKIDKKGNSSISIWGYGKIEHFNMLPIDTFEVAIKNNLLTEEEIKYYMYDDFTSNQTYDRKITIIELDSIKILEKPVDTNDDKIISSNVINFLDLYKNFGITNCYIDSKTILNIIDKKIINIKIKEQNKIIMLESILAVLNIAINARKVSEPLVKDIKNVISKLKGKPEIELEESTLNNLILTFNIELDETLNKYNRIATRKDYSEIEKDDYKAKIFSRAKKLLEGASNIKDKIPDYENLVKTVETLYLIYSK